MSDQFDMNELECPRCGGEMEYIDNGIPEGDKVLEFYCCSVCSYSISVYPDEYNNEHFWDAQS